METLDNSLLDEMVERRVAEFDPEQIYLFGSHAWGAATDDSDVDLCVVVSQSEENESERMFRAQRCLGRLLAPADILVRTRTQVKACRSDHTSLEHQIIDQGRLLYDSQA